MAVKIEWTLVHTSELEPGDVVVAFDEQDQAQFDTVVDVRTVRGLRSGEVMFYSVQLKGHQFAARSGKSAEWARVTR